jgi:hypothetical protein
MDVSLVTVCNFGVVVLSVNIGSFAVITASKPREQRINDTRTSKNGLPRYSQAYRYPETLQYWSESHSV